MEYRLLTTPAAYFLFLMGEAEVPSALLGSAEDGTLAFWAIAASSAFSLLAFLTGCLGGMLGVRLRRPPESGALWAG